MSIAFIVPCFNEANRTNFEIFKEWQEVHSDITLYFVNDGSSDSTLSVLHSYFDQSRVINLEENRGKAEAVRYGMRFLKEKNEYSHIGFFDADMATPLSELVKFEKIAKDGFKVIIGSRMARLGARINRKWYRHYLGRVFATLASTLLKMPVYDTQCGAKLFSREALHSILDTPFISKWIFDVELFLRLKSNSELSLEDYYEIPLGAWEDVAGSRLKITDFLKAPFELIQLYKRYG